MEGSSPTKEEVITERKAGSYLNHPCYFLEEALRALFGCLGFEIERNNSNREYSKGKKEHKSCVGKAPPSDNSEEDPPMNPEVTAITNNQKGTQEAPTPTPEEYSSTSTTQSCRELSASILARRGSGRSILTPGQPPQTN